MRTTRRLIALAVIAVGACGTQSRSTGTGPKKSGDLVFTVHDGGMLPGDDGSIDPGMEEDPCNERAKLVFVVDENDTLSSFKPDTLTFTNIGQLKCPASGGATPFSMAVDRNATAWVLYSSGELFKVDTKTAGCKATTFVPGQQGYQQFGMGFATNAMGSNDETLYVSAAADILGGGQQALGRIDLMSLKVARIGALGGSPELTGTGDAKLWGFFPEDGMPRVAQLDKTNAREMKTFPLPGLAGQPRAWAFAFWGGDFWIFLMRQNDASTSVYRLKQNGQVTTPLPNTGRTIVGAGVSTCAPLTPIG